jgi:hypothetical protein
MLLLEPADWLEVRAVLTKSLGFEFSGGTAAAARPLPAVGVAGGHARLARVEALQRKGEAQAPDREPGAGGGMARCDAVVRNRR